MLRDFIFDLKCIYPNSIEPISTNTLSHSQGIFPIEGNGIPAILQIDAIDTKLIRQMEITASASVNLDILVNNGNKIYLTLAIESRNIILDPHVFTIKC